MELLEPKLPHLCWLAPCLAHLLPASRWSRAFPIAARRAGSPSRPASTHVRAEGVRRQAARSLWTGEHGSYGISALWSSAGERIGCREPPGVWDLGAHWLLVARLSNGRSANRLLVSRDMFTVALFPFFFFLSAISAGKSDAKQTKARGKEGGSRSRQCGLLQGSPGCQAPRPIARGEPR